jgi:hypothetical protein
MMPGVFFIVNSCDVKVRSNFAFIQTIHTFLLTILSDSHSYKRYFPAGNIKIPAEITITFKKAALPLP